MADLLSSPPGCVLAVDFGGTKVDVAVAGPDGRVLATERLATDAARGAGQVVDRALDAAHALLADRPLLAAAAASPGIVLDDRILLAPNVPGWTELALAERLRDGLGIQAVVTATDVKAATLAELRWGALQGADPGVFLNLGTGLAAGIAIGGQVLAGAHGAAGEIGYALRGAAGRLEVGTRPWIVRERRMPDPCDDERHAVHLDRCIARRHGAVALHELPALPCDIEQVRRRLGLPRSRRREVADDGSGALALGQLELPVAHIRCRLLEGGLALRRGLLTPLDRCAAELDGSELLLAERDVPFLLAHGLLAGAKLDRERGQLGLALVELGRAVPKHLLDRAPEPACLLLAALEALDRLLQPFRLLLDLAAAVADQRVDCLLVVGRGEERPQPMANAFIRGLPAGPVLPFTIASRVSLHAFLRNG